jgi:ABC-2 type transport system ATP-binding protein
MLEPSDHSGAILQVQGLYVVFPRLIAVNDVSFDLQGGDLLGLIGPNGAGKTTLLRAIACLQPGLGTVKILGQTLTAESADLMRNVGFTPDTPPVYEELTVRQFLRFIARGYDLHGSEVDERIDFWLEKVWLTEKADQKIKQLSRGMRQRIGIARTMLPNPNIVLLDEPAAGLDPAGRVQFRQLLCSLREQRKAIIVSSHILSDMNEYCSHIGIMSAGKMVRFGTVAQVAAHEDDSRCRYTIGLAGTVGNLQQMVSEIEGVTRVELNHDGFSLEYSADRTHAAELLAALIARGVPVASFTPKTQDLEAAYLREGIRQVD